MEEVGSVCEERILDDEAAIRSIGLVGKGEVVKSFAEVLATKRTFCVGRK